MNHDTNEEKTEHPTEHRIKKFREKGQTRYSRELNSLLILLCGFTSLWWCRDVILYNFSKILFNSFSFNKNDILDKNKNFLDTFLSLKDIFFTFLPFLISLIIIIIVPPIFLGGIRLHFKSLKFNFKKLNVFNGLKKIFSFQMIIELFKIIIKLLVVGGVSFLYLWFCFPKILELINENYMFSLLYGYHTIFNCFFLIMLSLMPIVFFDIFWQQFTYYKKIKMTYQEVKDELKEKEGNPNIKMRIRQAMKAAVRRRMISDIPKADVIITNPTHCSVALQYDDKTMNAPKVIAKGLGEMAIKIQTLGLQNNIVIISVPSLARSLYRYTEIGEYIPGALYKAVAEVLAWVWKVRKWKKRGGIFPEKPTNIIVPSESILTGERKNND